MQNDSVKMKSNYAFIDGANLYNGVKSLGWTLDYARFRVWLKEKYMIEKAYLFIGMMPEYTELYRFLQECGFIVIFKEVIYDSSDKPKGNCDADLVLEAVKGSYENLFGRALIVSSDGDFSGLVKFLEQKNKLLSVLSPSNNCSVLIKRTGAKISYISSQKSILEYKRKDPR